MKAIFILHTLYISIHVIGFLFLYYYDPYCLTQINSKLEAYGRCSPTTIRESYYLWVSMLFGATIYIILYSRIASCSPEIRVKTKFDNIDPSKMFFGGLILLLSSALLILIIDHMHINYFKIRGLVYAANVYISNIMIAYAVCKSTKIRFDTWLLYFFVVMIVTFLEPTKLYLLFFLVNIGYYILVNNKNNLRNLIFYSIIIFLILVISYTFVNIIRAGGNLASVDELQSASNLFFSIITKIITRVTQFETTIFAASYPNIQEFFNNSDFLSTPRGFSTEVNQFLSDVHGYDLATFGYAVGLSNTFYAEFGLSGTIILSFITLAFFHVLHYIISFANIKTPIIIFFPFYITFMSDGFGQMIILFLFSLFGFIILKWLGREWVGYKRIF